MEKILLFLNSKQLILVVTSVVAGIVSFILADGKTWRALASEIVLAIFVGLFIAQPLAYHLNFSDNLTIAFVSIMSVTAKRFLMFIKDNYGELIRRITVKFIKK